MFDEIVIKCICVDQWRDYLQKRKLEIRVIYLEVSDTFIAVEVIPNNAWPCINVSK
jgi:hypothetical protein